MDIFEAWGEGPKIWKGVVDVRFVLDFILQFSFLKKVKKSSQIQD